MTTLDCGHKVAKSTVRRSSFLRCVGPPNSARALQLKRNELLRKYFSFNDKSYSTLVSYRTKLTLPNMPELALTARRNAAISSKPLNIANASAVFASLVSISSFALPIVSGTKANLVFALMFKLIQHSNFILSIDPIQVAVWRRLITFCCSGSVLPQVLSRNTSVLSVCT
jgi:hypothetical protein